MVAFTPVAPAAPLGAAGGPEEITLVKAGSYTATASQEFSVLSDCNAIEVFIDHGKVGAAPSTIFSVEGFDRTSGTWITLATTSAVLITSQVLIIVGSDVNPVAASVTGVSAQRVIRSKMRVTATHGNTDVATYSISASSN
jgi:hypothetical protein